MPLSSAFRVLSEELLQFQNEKKEELEQFRKQMEQRVELLQQQKMGLSNEVMQLKFWNEFLVPLLLCAFVGPICRSRDWFASRRGGCLVIVHILCVYGFLRRCKTNVCLTMVQPEMSGPNSPILREEELGQSTTQCL